jgi:hypothetical protein
MAELSCAAVGGGASVGSSFFFLLNIRFTRYARLWRAGPTALQRSAYR